MKNMYMLMTNLVSSIVNDNDAIVVNNTICNMLILKLKNNTPASKGNF